jgi:hypothetical protein
MNGPGIVTHRPAKHRRTAGTTDPSRSAGSPTLRAGPRSGPSIDPNAIRRDHVPAPFADRDPSPQEHLREIGARRSPQDPRHHEQRGDHLHQQERRQPEPVPRSRTIQQPEDEEGRRHHGRGHEGHQTHETPCRTSPPNRIGCRRGPEAQRRERTVVRFHQTPNLFHHRTPGCVVERKRVEPASEPHAEEHRGERVHRRMLAPPTRGSRSFA